MGECFAASGLTLSPGTQRMDTKYPLVLNRCGDQPAEGPHPRPSPIPVLRKVNAAFPDVGLA